MKIIDGWIDTAVEIDYGAKSMSRNGWKPLYICLHGTAGGSSAQGIATYFRDSDVEASAHIVVDQQGVVVQGISMEVAAWGNGVFTDGHKSWLPDANPNYYTISIEHVKSATDNSNQLTDAQKKASFQVIDCICSAYGIPRRAGDAHGGLISHADIDPVNRSRCPGPYPWSELYQYLATGDTNDMAEVKIGQGIGTNFKDVGNGQWKCNNGFVIGGRIRQYWAFYEGVFGLPKSNEIALSKSPATLQMFERVILVYDPNNAFDQPPRQPGTSSPEDVYLMHIDQGDGQGRIAKPLTDALNKSISALSAQVSSLQQQLASTQNANVEQLQAQVQDLTNQLSGAKSALSQIQSLAVAASK